ncbi:sodium:solute symporter family transporter [Blastopirellula marina]|uniref:Sodium-coupled permease n=1 Tax=Blastopirellula marina DSM 3645 TaxID=314230 RepID=A3ZZI5_9BACT|nr:sodium/solute symporter [Blastopirellula marina]EAQ78073.1 hypothetical protein DSM3645_18671 [Blastopirellula marina DSM 3645]
MNLLDYCVIFLYLLLMLGVGLYYARKNKTAEDFLLGGHQMSPVFLGLSLFATLVSTLSYLSTPGEVIAHGPMMACQVFAYPVIYLVVGFGLIPAIMRQPVTSAYELLEKRLGRGVRTVGATVFLLLRFGWMATILYATCEVVLAPLLGLDSQWTPLLCVALGVLTALYSSMGGIKAVVITDAIQSITMLIGAILALAVVTYSLGGISAWWPSQWPEHWQTPSWGFDPSQRISFGVLMVSTTLWYVCTNGSDQMSVQRFLSTRDAAAARKTFVVAQLTDLSVTVLLALTGVAVLGYYRVNAPELVDAASLQSGGDKIFPLFVISAMPAGLTGLVLAAIFSAALSSLSSGINSACAVIERDFISFLPRSWSSEERAVSRLRWMTWTVALVAIGLSMLNLLIEGNLLERCFKMVNLLTAPLFVLFFLALFVPWANAWGAWLGLAASTAVAIAVAYSHELGLGIGLSFVWIMPCALLAGITVGTSASAVMRTASSE